MMKFNENVTTFNENVMKCDEQIYKKKNLKIGSVQSDLDQTLSNFS